MPDARSGADVAAAVDPRVLRSREAIAEASIAQFVEHGYRGASLDDIAGLAGVAKGTIYNIYGDKEGLFRAIIGEAIDTAERFSVEVAANLGGTDDVENELIAAAQQLSRAVLGGRIVPLRRLLISEATRFPEFARDYYERAPGRVMATLAGGLRRFDERGLLGIDDAQMAAEQLAFLVLGASLDRALFEAESQPPEVVEARAIAGVRVFLRAYAPPSTNVDRDGSGVR